MDWRVLPRLRSLPTGNVRSLLEGELASRFKVKIAPSVLFTVLVAPSVPGRGHSRVPRDGAFSPMVTYLSILTQ